MERIESVKNPKVKQWKKLHTKKERENTGTFIIEGFHLVEEAIKNKDMINTLIVSEEVNLPHNWDVDNVRITFVTRDVMKAMSDTETPQGIAAICEFQTTYTPEKWTKVLLVDSVRDPGNLGTIIRTADAAGIDGLILGEGTVDHYNSKVIRSSQGSLFHLPIVKGRLQEWLNFYKDSNINVYGTSLQNGVSYKEVGAADQFCLLLGNEGSGVSSDLLDQTTKNLYIPIYGGAESLNVAIAAGILLYHLRK